MNHKRKTSEIRAKVVLATFRLGFDTLRMDSVALRMDFDTQRMDAAALRVDFVALWMDPAALRMESDALGISLAGCGCCRLRTGLASASCLMDLTK